MEFLQEIRIQPLKSGAGIVIPGEWPVDDRGLRFDHHWMVVQEGTGRFISQRTHPKMALLAPILEDGGRGSRLFIQVPGWSTIDVPLLGTEGMRMTVSIHKSHGIIAVDQGPMPARILSGFFGVPVRLVRVAPEDTRRTPAGRPSAFQDKWQILGASVASLDDLNERLSEPVDMAAFRPQLVFADSAPYAEDRWAEVWLGGVKLIGRTLCARCPIPDVEQSTGERREGKPVWRALHGYRSTRTPEDGTQVFFGRNFDFAEGTEGMLLRAGERVRVAVQDAGIIFDPHSKEER